MQLTSAIIVLCIITSVIKYLLSITTAVSSHTKYRETSYLHVSILIKAHIVVGRVLHSPRAWVQENTVVEMYSGKFLRGRNFRNFHDQTPARENLFPRNFLPPKFLGDKLRTPNTVCLSPRSSKSTEKLSQNHRAWTIQYPAYYMLSLHRTNCGNYSRPTITRLSSPQL